MEENRLLTPAKRKEIEVEITRRNLKLSDFSWENHKSEEFLEKTESLKNSRFLPRQRMELRHSYQVQYDNSTQKVSKLIHKGSSAFFTFDRLDNKWMSKFSFGQDYGTNKKIFSSSEEQIKFARNGWLVDLIQNLRADGLIEEDENNQSPGVELDGNEQIQEENWGKENLTDIEKADSLYEEIINKHPSTEKFVRSREPETKVQRDIQKIEDAISLYGTGFPKKKVELRQIKEKLDSQLPQTPDELSKTFWKNLSRFVKNKTGLRPTISIGIVVVIMAVIVLIAFFANVVKVKDSISNEQIPFVNKVTQTPMPRQTPTPVVTNTYVTNLSNSNTINANLPKEGKQKEVTVRDGQSAKAVEGKLIISVSGISYEENVGNALVHMVTGTVGEVGKKSIRFVRKEAGYSTRFQIDRQDYEIRLVNANTFEATFLITRIE